jgi:hypothetical protein
MISKLYDCIKGIKIKLEISDHDDKADCKTREVIQKEIFLGVKPLP